MRRIFLLTCVRQRLIRLGRNVKNDKGKIVYWISTKFTMSAFRKTMRKMRKQARTWKCISNAHIR